MTPVLILSALSLLSHFHGPVTLNVNAKNGDMVAGERSFRVTVQAANPVSKVEFYVDNEFRSDDTSTPYEFSLDGLSEKEGPIELKFKAYTTESEQGEVVLKLTVDNGLGKGIAFHVDRGNAFVRDGRYDDAITEGRIAQKIDEKSAAARLILARANYGKNVYDKAQKFAEDVVAADSQNVEALELLAAIGLQRVFTTFNRGTDQAETVAAIQAALLTAVDSRKKSLDVQFDRIGAPTDATLIAYADAAIKANRFGLAINALQPVYNRDQRRLEVANRLAYAMVRTGRDAEANQIVDKLIKAEVQNAYTLALKAVIATDLGDDTAAKAAISDGLILDSNDFGIITADAYMALQKNTSTALSGAVSKLQKFSDASANDTQKLYSSRAERYYFLSAMYNRMQNFPQGTRYFQRAVLAEPAMTDIYIESGTYSLGIVVNNNAFTSDVATDAVAKAQLATAEMYFKAALTARPESAEALVGLVALNLVQKKAKEAVDFGVAAVRAQPSSAVGYYALAAANNFLAKNLIASRAPADQLRVALQNAQNAMKTAEKLDSAHLSGRQVPGAKELLRYLKGYGRTPFLSAPK